MLEVGYNDASRLKTIWLLDHVNFNQEDKHSVDTMIPFSQAHREMNNIANVDFNRPC